MLLPRSQARRRNRWNSMTGISDDLARLISRIAAGRPATAEDDSPVRAPKPLYLLAVDDPDDRSMC